MYVCVGAHLNVNRKCMVFGIADSTWTFVKWGLEREKEERQSEKMRYERHNAVTYYIYMDKNTETRWRWLWYFCMQANIR